MFKRFFLRLTSSTWGGWCVFALLLVVVLGWIPLYFYLTPTDATPLMSDATPLMYVQLYVVIVIGLGSLYIAGTSFWAKRGSAFFVEYQTATDSNVAKFSVSQITLKEVIGNPANSTMPYVKRIYIRNEKNRHEAIKRILLQLPDKRTLVLKEYGTAEALIIKPYEDKVLKLNAVTAYSEKYNFSFKDNKIVFYGDKLKFVESKKMLNEGEIIIETVQGQSYIRSNKKTSVFYDKKKILFPLRRFLNEKDSNHTILGIDIFFVGQIFMRKGFLDKNYFYNKVADQLNSQGRSTSVFGMREGSIKIQIIFIGTEDVSLCYSFQANKKTYLLPVEKDLQEEFIKKYYNYNFDFENFEYENFMKQLRNLCRDWANEKWNLNQDNNIFGVSGSPNPMAIYNVEINTIDDEEPQKTSTLRRVVSLLRTLRVRFW